MLKKGNKLYSILTGTCPKCQGESMYEVKNPYLLGSIFKMHTRCSQCGTRYKIEPSFFYGAMYVSYGLGVAFAIAIFVVTFLIFGLGLLDTFLAIIIGLVLFLPVIIRLSRNIWINFFIHYDAKASRTP